MKKFVIVSVMFLLSASSVYAGCVDTFGIGSKATSLGGAFSAYADDPFAVYYNPAGLSQIEGKVISAGVHFVDPTIKLTDFTVGGEAYPDFSDESDVLVAPHLGYAMKITDTLAFGVAAYAPWGLELDWNSNPSNNIGAYSAHHSYYKRYGVTPGISYKINEKFAIGAGVTIGRSEAGADTRKYLLTDMGSYEIDHDNDPGTPNVAVSNVVNGVMTTDPITSGSTGSASTLEAYEYYSTQAASAPNDTIREAYTQYAGMMGSTYQAGYATGTAMIGAASPDHNADITMELEDDINYSYNIGMMFKPVETISVGLTYRSETDADFEGEAFVNGVAVSNAEMDYNHPQQLQAGVRYQPHNRFSIECDLVWTDWSINSSQIITMDNGVTLNALPFMSSTVSEEIYERKWEDTKQLRFGMEYVLNDIVTLRGGYFYDPTPIPDDTLDLQWPDADKKTYSLGAGFTMGRYTIDTVLQYTDIEMARIIGGESDNFNHSYHDLVGARADGYMVSGGVTLSCAF